MRTGRLFFRLYPAPTHWGAPGKLRCATFGMGLAPSLPPGARGVSLPKAFPPVSTVRSCFHNRRDSGLPAQINHAAVAPAGERDARDHRPRAGVMDSQGVKTTGNGGISGDDAGKGIKGRKRHIMTDTCGHPVALCAHAANIQDRDAAVGVFQGLRRDAPEPRHVSADCGDRGPKPRLALIPAGRWTIRIVRRCDTAEGFGVLPRRRVVEPALAGLGRCCRLARDREKTIESAEAQVSSPIADA